MYHAKHPEGSRKKIYTANNGSVAGAFMGFDSDMEEDDGSNSENDIEKQNPGMCVLRLISQILNCVLAYLIYFFYHFLTQEPPPPACWTPRTTCRSLRTSCWTGCRCGWTGCSRAPPTGTTSTTGQSSPYLPPLDGESPFVATTGSKQASRLFIWVSTLVFHFFSLCHSSPLPQRSIQQEPNFCIPPQIISIKLGRRINTEFIVVQLFFFILLYHVLRKICLSPPSQIFIIPDLARAKKKKITPGA